MPEDTADFSRATEMDTRIDQLSSRINTTKSELQLLRELIAPLKKETPSSGHLLTVSKHRNTALEKVRDNSWKGQSCTAENFELLPLALEGIASAEAQSKTQDIVQHRHWSVFTSFSGRYTRITKANTKYSRKLDCSREGLSHWWFRQAHFS